VPAGDEQCGLPTRGWNYLLYGRWLVVWALAGTPLATTGGPIRRRRVAAGRALAGAALAAGLCGLRLIAEVHRAPARYREAACAPGAREALAEALRWCPERERLERTWLLTGKRALREGRAIPQRSFSRAARVARDKGRPRVVTCVQDLAWVIPGVTDCREGFGPLPAGPCRAKPGAVGIFERRAFWWPLSDFDDRHWAYARTARAPCAARSRPRCGRSPGPAPRAGSPRPPRNRTNGRRFRRGRERCRGRPATHIIGPSRFASPAITPLFAAPASPLLDPE
jgi:hypothetical protein